jgi:hypothetical protein
MPRKGFRSHAHRAVVHNHDHTHITHYVHARTGVEHLMASHRHAHNHARIEHAHLPHEEAAREHGREAHIHDHEHPAES